MIIHANISHSRRALRIAFAAFAIVLATAWLAPWAQPAYADDLQPGRIDEPASSADAALAAQANETIDVTVWATYGQTDARAVLKLVNDFRHSDDAWYWSSDNKTKVKCTGLADLAYDYSLEKAAMQRAAELALSFSHTRPDGTTFATAIDTGGTSPVLGENIGAGYSTPQNIFNGWREDDEKYDKQGHRRAMLSESYTAMGVGHVVVNGNHYWAQEFSSIPSGAAETKADNSTHNATMKAAVAKLSTAQAIVQTDTVTVVEGETADLPSVSALLAVSEDGEVTTWPGPTLTATVAVTDWTVADTSIAEVADGKLEGKKAGTTKMTSKLFDGTTATMTVAVKADISNATVSFPTASFVYDGTAKTPAPVVVRDGDVLKEGSDYTVEYSKNTSAGTATVTVKGAGNYTGSAQGTFEITPAPIDVATVSVSAQRYTGKALTPPLVVMYNGKALAAGVDYEATYANNVNVGTATVTLTGMGNFGGETKASFKIVDDAASWKRLQGDVALDTMAAIVNEGWSNWQPGGTVVLTTVDGYWDALTAAGVAGMANAPVLMTDTDSLSAQTKAAITSLKPATIVVCGGEAAVTEATAEAAAKAAGGATVVRCWGATATRTAVDAYKRATIEGMGTWSETAFVCTNDGYWDALAAAPISYAKAMPIFLTEGASDIADETLTAMKDGGVKKVYIVGGYAAIDQAVADKIAAKGMKVAGRLAGDTAVETSEKVAVFGLDCGLTCQKMGVATTNGYWDALSGAALCGLNGSVLVLAGDAGAHSISGFVKSHATEVGAAYVFGGEAAVDAATYQALQKAVK